MIFQQTSIPGCFLIEPEPRYDERGAFARLFCTEEFAAQGIDFVPAQINRSHNIARHTLRGLHFQDPPHAEAKLVGVSKGAIFDVAVDLRPDSPAFRRWCAFELDAASGRQVYIPEGCAHGFLTLGPGSEVSYVMGRHHVPGQAKGYRYDDPAFAITWPAAPDVIGQADLAWPAFSRQGPGRN